MTETGSIDITGIAVALGRIEEKVSHLTAMDDRLRNVEADVTELKARQRPAAPWWLIVGGVAAFAALAVNSIVLVNLLGDIAKALP